MSRFVLVHFFEEKKFAVMKSKDALPKEVLEIDVTTWKPSNVVEVKWQDNSYPAHLLQFGDDKKLMDKTIDDLANGMMASTDLPIIQQVVPRRIKIKEKENFNSKGKKKVPLKTSNEKKKDFFLTVRGLVKEKKNPCNNCDSLQGILKNKNEEIERLLADLKNRENLLEESKQKYKEMKRKYKEKKREIKERNESEPMEGIKFGTLTIPKQKVSLCRDKDYSKYVGDLLEICFGRDILSQSVLKCPSKRTSKTSILDQEIVNDIICHTLEKFSSISVTMVRAAIRQKLNTCHKAKKIK